MSKRRAYSWDFKAEVLAVYEVDGPAAAARMFKVPRCTIQRWAKAALVDTSSETKKQTEAALDSLKARRLRIRDKLAERAEEMLDRMGESMTVYVGSGATPQPIQIDKPSASVCKDLATTAGILIDKFRLEEGEATARSEVTVTKHDRELAVDKLTRKMLDEAERITRSASKG